jgi:hypothetical protein
MPGVLLGREPDHIDRTDEAQLPRYLGQPELNGELGCALWIFVDRQ